MLEELERGGMKGCDISDDEMAKSHARYMVGGASDVPNERVFRFGETLFSPQLTPLTFLPAPPLMNPHVYLSFLNYCETHRVP